jgi:hypothetical protein
MTVFWAFCFSTYQKSVGVPGVSTFFCRRPIWQAGQSYLQPFPPASIIVVMCNTTPTWYGLT